MFAPPYLGSFFVFLFSMSAMDGHDSQPLPDPQHQHASAEERIAEQAREIQQLREQLAKASVKEGPALPPLSVPELNKALEQPQLTQWMRLILSNLKAYVRLMARGFGEVPRPVQFKGQVANDMMDLGEQPAWRTWECVNQYQTAWGATGTSSVPTGPDHRTPPPPPGQEAPRGARRRHGHPARRPLQPLRPSVKC